MEHKCNYLCSGDESVAAWSYETERRGTKYLCERCYQGATLILRSFCVREEVSQ